MHGLRPSVPKNNPEWAVFVICPVFGSAFTAGADDKLRRTVGGVGVNVPARPSICWLWVEGLRLVETVRDTLR